MAGMILCLAFAALLAAQNRLYVFESGDKFHPVLKVSGDRPFVLKQGKLVASRGQRFALKKVEEYLPVLITVRDIEAMTSSLYLLDLNVRVNNEFQFSAKFESSDALEDVFLVLELELADMGKRIFIHEIGRLEPWIPKPISVAVMALGTLGAGQLKLHVFAGGAEVFHTGQPPAYREEMLDQMVAKRIAGVQQAGPRAFFGPAPEYPQALRGAGVDGKAVVTVHISERGEVTNPVVTSATDPAFGEAALAVIRMWRFLPQVRNGRPVETVARIPFDFVLPDSAGKN